MQSKPDELVWFLVQAKNRLPVWSFGYVLKQRRKYALVVPHSQFTDTEPQTIPLANIARAHDEIVLVKNLKTSKWWVERELYRDFALPANLIPLTEGIARGGRVHEIEAGLLQQTLILE